MMVLGVDAEDRKSRVTSTFVGSKRHCNVLKRKVVDCLKWMVRREDSRLRGYGGCRCELVRVGGKIQ